MKKIVFTTIAVFTIGCFISCNNCKENGCKDPIPSMEKSDHLISINYSKSLYNNFKFRFRDSIQKIQLRERVNANGYDPTQYVLLNIETLECYLKFLREVEKKGNNQKITGLALFLGANNLHEKAWEKPGFNELHQQELNEQEKLAETKGDSLMLRNDISGRITVFMAPTYRMSDDQIGSFNMDANTISEVQRHVPFYIKPTNKEIDPYDGTYRNLLKYYMSDDGTALVPNFTQDMSFGPNPSFFIPAEENITNEGTSLILEELTDMPPRTPINSDSQ